MDNTRKNELINNPIKKKNNGNWKYIILFIIPILLFLISFTIGRYSISISDLLKTFYYHFVDPSKIVDANMETVLFNVRLPRVIAVLLVGGGLSVTGAAYQGMFQNPLISPDILGASAGAGLGAALGLLLSKSSTMVQIYAFGFCLASVFLTTLINKLVAKDPILGLVLGGMLVASLLSASTSYIKLVADADDKLPSITFWLMGGFSSIVKEDIFSTIIPFIIGFFILFRQRWQLNVISFGEEEARSLGVNTKMVRRKVIFASTLIIGASVSISGIIGWVGVVIPHLARAIVGPNYKKLLTASLLIGASYLLIVDNCIRTIWTAEPPIGIITSVLGVPFFLFILKNNTKGWS